MILKYFMLIVILFFNGNLFASEDFYTIKVESVSQNTTTISQDIEKAFQRLEKKLTNVEQLPTPSYEQITNIVEQYQYVEEEGRQFLLIDFDKKAMMNYLNDNHLMAQKTISQKPLLLYVAQKVGDKEELLDIESNAIVEIIINQAEKEGFSLISPAVDLNYLEEVHFNDIWHANAAVFEPFVERYQAKGVLIVQLQRKEGDDWHSNWHLFQSKNHIETSVANVPIQGLTSQALQDIKLKQQNIKPIVQNIQIQAMHQNSQIDYEKMFNNLKKTPGVLTVQIDSVTPDSVFYKLSINTDKETLMNKLKGHIDTSMIKVTP